MTTHAIKPGRDDRPATRHAMLWVDQQTIESSRPGRRKRVISPTMQLWWIDDLPQGTGASYAGAVDSPWGLAEALEAGRGDKGRLTLWLPRGWTDFVLAGIPELLERRRWRYRWLTLDGARTVLVGQLDHRPADITSLACWTGGQWDEWRRYAEGHLRRGDTEGTYEKIPADCRAALGSVVMALGAGRLLHAGPVKLTIASQSRALWRAWLSPVLDGRTAPGAKGARAKGKKKRVYCLPLPGSPPAARRAERHVCYGLLREQYFHGRADGPIYAYDLRSAYLISLMSMAMPAAFGTGLKSPRVDQLADALRYHVGAGLVRVRAQGRSYPIRLNGRTYTAKGHYWTWLAGDELLTAVTAGDVVECERAWLWLAVQMPETTVNKVCYLLSELEQPELSWLRPVWRTIYSALVGSWAQWGREWHDAQGAPAPRDWCQWTQHDPETGEATKWRSIAGRLQKLVATDDSRNAAPIMYACVLARVRTILERVRSLLPLGSHLATVADCLWVTEAGAQVLDGMGRDGVFGGGLMARKEVWDCAWLDGRGRAVVLKDGAYHAQALGVPAEPSVGDDGRVRWVHVGPWDDPLGPNRKRGVPLGASSWSADRIVRENGGPLAENEPARIVMQPELREELLLDLQHGKG